MKHFLTKHIFLILTLAAQGANTADTAYTVRNLNRGGVERTPFARPITNLPRPAYVGASESMAASASLFGWKMKHSEKKWVRKVWWLPQALTIVSNTEGTVYSARH